MINKFYDSILITLNFLVAMNFSNGFTPHPRALLFDIDGTLSDSFRLGFESTQKVLVNNGYKLINEDEYHQGNH
jgi:trehalose-6-phosphatase